MLERPFFSFPVNFCLSVSLPLPGSSPRHRARERHTTSIYPLAPMLSLSLISCLALRCKSALSASILVVLRISALERALTRFFFLHIPPLAFYINIYILTYSVIYTIRPPVTMNVLPYHPFNCVSSVRSVSSTLSASTIYLSVVPGLFVSMVWVAMFVSKLYHTSS
ncbi:hypothetical protein BJ322DRAFT_829934 [Thelephora terrestris]|uniref:Uncharacterized protein n=1 Tax=Thelephora terrestris TaxID=56493 RepID=A0A9P6HEE4_9AGAM|nr:hypothetical protein BJ322DRAFT_829934 [Thelephora terrestris]